ncbi:MAG: PAS domain-containing protein [Proteobacteria bacterium]|nr:PAS domain-containing protein [Pseudomonadota bacterium]
MNTADGSQQLPVFMESPRHPDLIRLWQYWSSKRGAKKVVPARADILPSEIKSLLPDVMIWNAEGVGGPYVIRLVGEHIVRFVGQNNIGQFATVGMPVDAAAMINYILTRVLETHEPLFRSGKAFWHVEKSYRNFEACYLPMSSGNGAVTMILGGVKFDVNDATSSAP